MRGHNPSTKNWARQKTTLGLFVCLMLFPLSSFAYLDPGTGSIILQGVIGSIAVALATGRMWWYRVKGLFSSDKEPSPDSNEENNINVDSKVDD